MLTNLHVKNIALIDEAEIEFEKGFNVLTGETGAGKSILMGCVGFALGQKMTSASIGKYGDYALIEMIFSVENPRIAGALSNMGIETEDGQLILTRKIMEGRSISRMNGETCTVSQMKAAASLLLDVHGQRENQSLLSEKKQMDVLDHYMGDSSAGVKADVREKHRACEKIRRELEDCQIDAEQRQREIDFLQFEIDEIRQAEPVEGEDEELERQYRLMENARKITDVLGQVYDWTGYDGEYAAGEMIGRAAHALSGIAPLDDALERMYRQALDIEGMIGDLSRDIDAYLEGISFSDEDYLRVQDRLNEINRLKGKYGSSISEILAYADRQDERLDQLLHMEERRERLTVQLAEAEEELVEACEKLTKLRREAAAALETAVSSALGDLNFARTAFEIRFQELPHPTADGQDRVTFLISTNPGEPLRPLSQVASGGELSRITLAIKTLMADRDDTEVLIFDEIDTGISGRTAQKVAEQMAKIAAGRQIICITHLPQIAAMADVHFEIVKQIGSDAATTRIRKLNEEETVREIARLLGGAQVTQRVMENAAEMLELAVAAKRTYQR